MNKSNTMISILGPTATGKTKLAAHVAARINGEIISADSRQVYKGMDIGTGKDLCDYQVGNVCIPYHLIDIREPGYEYNVYEFQHDFLKAYQLIISLGKTPVLCGGTGLYLESVIKGYFLANVPPNEDLRKELELQSDSELIKLLSQYKNLHNVSDSYNRSRLIRAIEICVYEAIHPPVTFPKIYHNIFGIYFDRHEIRKRITQRLEHRMKNGLIEEVQQLIKNKVTPDQLKFYGLEYKFITQYVVGEITFTELFSLLNTAIHQFAKRQMTWFRKMEKQGIKIQWIDGKLSLDEKVELICIHLTQ